MKEEDILELDDSDITNIGTSANPWWFLSDDHSVCHNTNGYCHIDNNLNEVYCLNGIALEEEYWRGSGAVEAGICPSRRSSAAPIVWKDKDGLLHNPIGYSIETSESYHINGMPLTVAQWDAFKAGVLDITRVLVGSNDDGEPEIRCALWNNSCQLHNKYGPAVRYFTVNNGCAIKRRELWLVNNKFHRLTGPAETYYNVDGTISQEIFWYKGKRLSGQAELSKCIQADVEAVTLPASNIMKNANKVLSISEPMHESSEKPDSTGIGVGGVLGLVAGASLLSGLAKKRAIKSTVKAVRAEKQAVVA